MEKKANDHTNVKYKNRQIRQEALREFMSKKCTVQQIIKNLEKIEALDPESPTFSNDLTKYKTANDQRIRLLAKYLPDLKSSEITGPDGQSITIEVIRFASNDSKQLAS